MPLEEKGEKGAKLGRNSVIVSHPYNDPYHMCTIKCPLLVNENA